MWQIKDENTKNKSVRHPWSDNSGLQTANTHNIKGNCRVNQD